MKSGKSLVDLATELQRQLGTKKDYIAPASSLHYTDPDNVIIRNINTFGANKLFNQQLASHIDYPYAFWQRSAAEHPDQWRELVNAYLSVSHEKRMIRTMDGTSRAFLSDRYRTIDNWDVAEAGLEAVGNMNGWTVESCDLTETRLYIKVVSPLTREVSVGDPVQAGFVISNSEVGLGAVSVQPLVYRLSCKNGAIVQDYGVTKKHVGRNYITGDDGAYELFSDETRRLSDRALIAQIGDVVKTSVNEAKFALVVDRFAETLKRPIEGDPVKATEILAKQVSLNEMERVSVLQHLISGGTLTQYGLINAVTATAQSNDLSYDRATQLEAIGGKMIDMPVSDWRSIATAGKAA